MASSRHSIGIIFPCLLLAVCTWGYVSLSRTYEDEFAMPLVVVPPANQALLSTVPASIVVRARGTGIQLINLKLFNRTATCTLDLSKLREASQGVYKITRDDLVRSISTARQINTVSVIPSSMTLAIGDLAVRTVPVRLRTNFSTRESFRVIGTPSVYPTTVQVRGSKVIVDKITEWPTQRLSLADVHTSFENDLPVSDSLMTLVNVVPSVVRVKATVQQMTDIALDDVPVVLIDAGNTRYLDVRPKYVRVILRGGVEELANMTAEDVRVEVSALTGDAYARPRVITSDRVTVMGTIPAFVRVVDRGR
ncbi:MAG: CdaR family protein [bacterium]|nr:CdaR family protein [bacterium]